MRSVNRLFPIWVILGCAVAYKQPHFFSGFLSDHVALFFGITMFGIGVTLELGKSAGTLKRLDKILPGSFAQFSIMPLSAYALTRLIEIRPELALGLVLTHFKDQSGVALPSAIFTVWCIVSASLFTLTPYRTKDENPSEPEAGGGHENEKSPQIKR